MVLVDQIIESKQQIIIKKLLLFLIINSLLIFGQAQFNADQVFKEAREAAFAGDRVEAIELCQEILQHYPEYYDVRLFLARVYAWEKQYQKAREEVQQVLKQDKKNLSA